VFSAADKWLKTGDYFKILAVAKGEISSFATVFFVLFGWFWVL
jgi:hypothetical protein